MRDTLIRRWHLAGGHLGNGVVARRPLAGMFRLCDKAPQRCGSFRDKNQNVYCYIVYSCSKHGNSRVCATRQKKKRARGVTYSCTNCKTFLTSILTFVPPICVPPVSSSSFFVCSANCLGEMLHAPKPVCIGTISALVSHPARQLMLFTIVHVYICKYLY